MKQQNAYVRENGTTVIKCPYCSSVRTVSVTRFKGKKKTIKIRCSCHKTFSVLLELRRMFRKKTLLKGTYINHSQVDDRGVSIKGKIIIKDVSMGGIGFETVGKCTIEKDDQLEVTFTLDDIHSSEITKQVEVKSVRGKYVGCEFEHTTQDYDKALGFYLLP